MTHGTFLSLESDAVKFNLINIYQVPTESKVINTPIPPLFRHRLWEPLWWADMAPPEDHVWEKPPRAATRRKRDWDEVGDFWCSCPSRVGLCVGAQVWGFLGWAWPWGQGSVLSCKTTWPVQRSELSTPLQPWAGWNCGQTQAGNAQGHQRSWVPGTSLSFTGQTGDITVPFSAEFLKAILRGDVGRVSVMRIRVLFGTQLTSIFTSLDGWSGTTAH